MKGLKPVRTLSVVLILKNICKEDVNLKKAWKLSKTQTLTGFGLFMGFVEKNTQKSVCLENVYKNPFIGN